MLNGEISLSNGTGSTSIHYPSGLNKDNCIPISIGVNISTANFYDYYNCSNHIFGAILNSEEIIVKIRGFDGVGSNGIKKVRIVLMKIS